MHKLLSAAQCAHKHCAIFDHKAGKQILNNLSSAQTSAYFYALEKLLAWCKYRIRYHAF